MIIVDTALEARRAAGDPVRVGVVGAGFAGRGLVHQITEATPGMEVSVVVNRTLDEAAKAFTDIGIHDFATVSTAAQLAAAMAKHQPAITDDPTLVTGSDRIEAVVEATGEIEFGSQTAVAAIDTRPPPRAPERRARLHARTHPQAARRLRRCRVHRRRR